MTDRSWFEPIGEAIHSFIRARGGQPVIDYFKASRFEKLIETYFPLHLKQNVNILIIATAIIGAITGFLIFYLVNTVFNRKKREDDGAVEEEEGKSKFVENERGPMSALTEEDEEHDDDGTSYKILKGCFNKSVINNLRRWNNENGELIRLGYNAESEDDDDEDEEEDEDDSGSDSGQSSAIDEKDIKVNFEEISDIVKQENEEKEGNEKKKKNSITEGMTSIGEQEMMKKLGTLHGKLATAKLRQESMKMKKKMSANEREEESKIRAKQLEAIMSLMQADQDKFGPMSEKEVVEQMESLYNI